MNYDCAPCDGCCMRPVQSSPEISAHKLSFDICLPVRLARNNKIILGSLFVAGELVLLWRQVRRPGI
jgi:hypothetical protein